NKTTEILCIGHLFFRDECLTSEYTDQYITPRRITAPMDLPFWSTSCQSTFVRLRFNIPGQYITNIPARHSRQEHENAKGVRQTFPSCSLRSLGWSVLVLCLRGQNNYFCIGTTLSSLIAYRTSFSHLPKS